MVALKNKGSNVKQKLGLFQENPQESEEYFISSRKFPSRKGKEGGGEEVEDVGDGGGSWMGEVERGGKPLFRKRMVTSIEVFFSYIDVFLHFHSFINFNM